MNPHLTHVFTLRGTVSSDTVDLGARGAGPQRLITALDGGFLRGVPGTRGEGMDASLVPGGSDWVTFDAATNTVEIDVRTQGKLSTGEGVYVQYAGYMKIDEASGKFMARAADAVSTRFGDHHWWTRPIIETSSPRFKWTETTMFVARGRCCMEDGVQSVEYQIFEVGQ